MNTKRRIVTLGIVGMAIGLTAIGIQSRVQAVPFDLLKLDGSFWVRATWDTQSAQALATFSYGGGVVETPNVAFGLSNGHGAWESLGNRNFAIKVIYFRWDDVGNPIGTTEVQSWVRLTPNGDFFNGRFRTFVKDMDDNLEDSFDGTAWGTRIEFDD